MIDTRALKFFYLKNVRIDIYFSTDQCDLFSIVVLNKFIYIVVCILNTSFFLLIILYTTDGIRNDKYQFTLRFVSLTTILTCYVHRFNRS